MPPDTNIPQDSPELDAMLVQHDAHHRDVSAQLDALIHQGEKNNPEPVLEAILQTQARTADKLAELVLNTRPREVQLIEVAGPIPDAVRGARGDRGPQGAQGERGETGPEGPQGPRGERGEQGAQGERGGDGADGLDGTDGKDGDPGPPGVRGPRGDDGSPDTGAEIVGKLSALKGKERLSYHDLKDAPAYRHVASKDEEGGASNGRIDPSGMVHTPVSYVIKLATDVYIGFTNTSVPRTLTLPSAVTAGDGRYFTVKDESYAAKTNPITITPILGQKVDGDASFSVNSDRGAVHVISDGHNWQIY